MSELISLHDVTIRRDGETVLRHVSFALNLGERLAIIGPNGAGKTTLLRTLMGLERDVQGAVRLFGTDCSEENQFRPLRPRIGYLFQDSDDQLFCPTAIEDVAFGPLNMGCTQDEALLRAQSVLDELGIGSLAQRISHRLSGGEKRLVCLAGLLAMKPDVLMLDEPTNGVDVENARRLRAALQASRQAMILVSHDDRFIAEFATRAMVLSDGNLLPAEVHKHEHAHNHPHIHRKPI